MTFPKEHRLKLHSTNPIERLNGEIKRRTEVVGIFPNEAAITRLIGAILMEQSDEWAVQRARYRRLKPWRRSATIPSSCSRLYTARDRLIPSRNARWLEKLHHAMGHDHRTQSIHCAKFPRNGPLLHHQNAFIPIFTTRVSASNRAGFSMR